MYDIMSEKVIKMIYLDYSATTPIHEDVLDTFCKVARKFPGNPNSLHKLGVETKHIIQQSTKQIADILGVKESEIIYTSGASEANNFVLKGVCDAYPNRGKHIITTRLEHSSIYGPLSYLMKKGYEVDFVDVDKNGLIDINQLKDLLRKDTLLVSISAVNSEIGLRQKVEEIALLLQEYPKCFFHVDATQCIGKDAFDLSHIDFVSFTAHKFYGPVGIGALIKKEGIEIEPLIHGGKSTTKYRSGTPTPALIASFAKALRLATTDLEEKYNKVKKYNDDLIAFFTLFPAVFINHNSYCLPHMLNISIPGIRPETFQHALEEYDIYISTQSACSSTDSSGAVMAFTGDEARASSSIRISLSTHTTEEEIEKLKEAFKECYQKLHLKY